MMIYKPRSGLFSPVIVPRIPVEIDPNSSLGSGIVCCYIPGSPHGLTDIRRFGPKLSVNGSNSASFLATTQVGIGLRSDNGSPSGALSSNTDLSRLESADMTFGWYGFITGNPSAARTPVWGISKPGGSHDLMSIGLETATGSRFLWMFGNGASADARVTTATRNNGALNAVALSYYSDGTLVSAVNGVAGGNSSATVSPVYDGTERLCLGCNAYNVTIVPNTRDLIGVIWNRRLTQDELTQWTREPFSILRPGHRRSRQGVISGLSQSISDSITGSENYSSLMAASRTVVESASSSDLSSIGLADSSATLDGYFVTIDLADSIASSDEYTIPVALSSDNVLTSDLFSVLTAFPFTLTDSAVSSDNYFAFIQTGAFEYSFECGPIAIFPSLPTGFPVKLSLVMDTVIGTTKSLREIRVAQQTYPLWDIELVFEELLDQTQNQMAYTPFAGDREYEQLVQQWLMSYGQTGVFAFDAPWDDSRTDQPIGTGDGVTTQFPIFRTWGTGAVVTEAPIGVVNTVTNVKINGTTASSASYYTTRSYLVFFTPPPAGASITMTLSFYYLCRFVADEQDFEEFAKNRWTVPSLKFRAVYWPGCQ